METYAASRVPREELRIFVKIEKVVQKMAKVELEKNKQMSCHLLARALARFFPVECRDGYFGKCNKHSWLVTKTGNIIDSYPVAVIGGPLFIDMKSITPWLSLYNECPLPELNDAGFLADVVKVTEVVRKTMLTLGIQ